MNQTNEKKETERQYCYTTYCLYITKAPFISNSVPMTVSHIEYWQMSFRMRN